MAQEDSDSRQRLIEDLCRNSLLVRAESKSPEFLQPNAYRIAYSVSQMPSRRNVDLDPRALGMDSRPHLIAENGLRQSHDFVSQNRIFRRVLDRVRRQCAAITDQVPQEPQLLWTHAVLYGTLNDSPYGNSI